MDPLTDFQEALRQIDEEVQLIVLVTGTLEDGSAHYAYASIPPSKYQAFKNAEAVGNYDLTEYGKILAHGEGLEPPEEVKKRMEDEHGADHMFEEQLQEMMNGLNTSQ